MSIQSDALIFQKEIWNSPRRTEVLEAVKKLKPSERGLGNKIYPSPVLGLLLYDQESLKRHTGKSAIEELADWNHEERFLLFGVHEEIQRFNNQCLKPLREALPAATKSVNPYRHYPHGLPSGGMKDTLLEKTNAEKMVKSFHAHPAFQLAISTSDLAKELAWDYERIVYRIETAITESVSHGESEWVSKYKDAVRNSTSGSGLLVHIGALLSLRSSLSNLDQLIVQSLFQEELLKLERHQIIDYVWTTSGAGPRMWLMHIPYNLMYAFEVTDLIFINTDRNGEPHGLGDVLCSIHSQSLPLNHMNPGILKMQMIDENLNSYRYLLI